VSGTFEHRRVRRSDIDRPALFAYHGSGAEESRKIPLDRVGGGTLWIPRDKEQLNKFWALIKVVEDATGARGRQIKELLLTELDYVDVVVDRYGDRKFVLRSIATEGGMEQDEFNEFFSQAVDFMAKLIAVTREELLEEFWRIYQGQGSGWTKRRTVSR
jgi:hypothetical protein